VPAPPRPPPEEERQRGRQRRQVRIRPGESDAGDVDRDARGQRQQAGERSPEPGEQPEHHQDQHPRAAERRGLLDELVDPFGPQRQHEGDEAERRHAAARQPHLAALVGDAEPGNEQVVRQQPAAHQQRRVDGGEDRRDQRAGEQGEEDERQVVLRQRRHDLLGVREPGQDARSGHAQGEGDQPRREIEPATEQRRTAGHLWRARGDDARHQLGRHHRAADRDRPLLEQLPEAALGAPEAHPLVGEDAGEEAPGTAVAARHAEEEGDQSADDEDALHEVGHGVGEQTAEHRVEDDERRRQHDGAVDVERRGGRQHVSEAADLRRRPKHRARDHHHRRPLLHAHRVARAEQIGQRREVPPPERHGEDPAHQDQAEPVAERLGVGERDAVAVGVARRPHHRLGAEPGGEDRKDRQRIAEPAPGQQVVRFAADSPRHPDPDPELQDEVGEQGEKGRRHGRLGERAGILGA
jgi:hypothetical protein